MNKESLDSLVYRLHKSDERAFQLLFENLFEQLLKKAMYYVKDRQVAKDIVQEIFLNLWKNRMSFNAAVPVKNYLERACINRALNYLRDQGKFLGCTEDDAVHYTPTLAHESPHAQVAFGEFQQKIFEFIDSLPDKVKVPFILSRFEGMSYREISEAMGISEIMVERSIMKARKLLRTFLALPPMSGRTWLEK